LQGFNGGGEFGRNRHAGLARDAIKRRECGLQTTLPGRKRPPHGGKRLPELPKLA
jgi:hypothetical protein